MKFLIEKYQVGSKIKIIGMNGEPDYSGKEGEITYIDDMGQLHGTWGGLAIIPEEDKFEILEETLDKKTDSQINKDFNELEESAGYRVETGFIGVPDIEDAQSIVDHAIELFGRVPGGLYDDLDSAGFYIDADNKVHKTIEEDFSDEKRKHIFEICEGVTQDNPYLKDGIKLWLKNPDAKHLIVSVKPYKGQFKNTDIEINKLTNDSDFDAQIKELYKKYGDDIDISVIHNKSQLTSYEKAYDEAIKEIETEKNGLNEDYDEDDYNLDEDFRVWGQEDIDNNNALASIAKQIKKLFDKAGDVNYDDIIYDVFDYGSEIKISNVLDPYDIGSYIEDELGFHFKVEDLKNNYGDLYIDTSEYYEDANGDIQHGVSIRYLNED